MSAPTPFLEDACALLAATFLKLLPDTKLSSLDAALGDDAALGAFLEEERETLTRAIAEAEALI